MKKIRTINEVQYANMLHNGLQKTNSDVLYALNL